MASTDFKMAKLNIKKLNGEIVSSEVEQTPGQTLMELLIYGDYGILGACGGMALCGTCHIQIIEGGQKLPAPSLEEREMLELLPNVTPASRLSCQINLTDDIDSLYFKIMPDD
jgi:ferredoxin